MHEKRPAVMVLRYFLLLFFLSILLVGRLLWPFLSILILSYLLTTIFKPVFNVLSRKLSPNFSSLMTCMLIVLIVFLPLTFFVGALSQEAYSLYQWGKGANLAEMFKDLQSSSYVRKAQEVLGSFGVTFETESIGNTVSEIIKTFGLFLYNQAREWAANIMQFLFDFFMMIIVIFFLLIDHERLMNYIVSLSPLPDQQERRLFGKFEEIAGAVLIGNGICGVIQGVLGGTLFAVFGLGPPVLWGGVMAILAFLPIFGIGLVLIPEVVILLLKGRTGLAVFVLIFYVLVSFTIEYAMKPKIVGKRVKMHTLLVFLAIMGGLSVFGVLGIIYGPLIITAFLTLAEIYRASYYEAVVKGTDSC